MVLGAVCKSRDLRLTQPPHNLNLSWDRDLIFPSGTLWTPLESQAPRAFLSSASSERSPRVLASQQLPPGPAGGFVTASRCLVLRRAPEGGPETYYSPTYTSGPRAGCQTRGAPYFKGLLYNLGFTGQSQQLRKIKPRPKATLLGGEGGPCPPAFLPPAARFLAAAPLRLDNWTGRDRPGALGGGLGGRLRPEAGQSLGPTRPLL